MKELLIVGTGDFADVVSYVLREKLGRAPAAYAVNREYLPAHDHLGDVEERRSCHGVPLIALEEMTDQYSPDEYEVVLAVIGKQMFRQRAAAAEQIRRMGYHLANVADPSAQVDTETLGEGNIILANCSIERHCRIGDGNIIWQNVVMPHHNVLGNFNNLAPSVSFSGYSEVGNHCFVGNNVCIKNRVKISDYAYIGAGAYVSKSVASGSVVVPHRSYVLEGKSGFEFL